MQPKSRAQNLDKSFVLVLMAAPLALSVGCGKSSSSSSYNFPSIAPVVNAALPAKLQAGSTSSVEVRDSLLHDRTALTGAPLQTLAASYVTAMFQQGYAGSNGTNAIGFINTLVQNIDTRMQGISTQMASFGSNATCTTGAPVSYTVDLSSIDPMLKFTMPNLQCMGAFNASDTVTYGGMLFGQNGTNYSLVTNLGPMSGTYAANGGFQSYANLTNYGSTSTSAPETLDAMLINYTPPSKGGQLQIIRFKAVPTTNTFELFIGGNSSNTAGTSNNTGVTPYLGAGFRMISDGVHIYADGTLYEGISSNLFDTFSVCMTASTLAVDSTAGDCSALEASFTLSTTASLNFASVTGWPNGAMVGSSCTGQNTSSDNNLGSNLASSCVPNDSPGNTIYPTSAINTLIQNAFPIAQANVPSLPTASSSSTTSGH